MHYIAMHYITMLGSLPATLYTVDTRCVTVVTYHLKQSLELDDNISSSVHMKLISRILHGISL